MVHLAISSGVVPVQAQGRSPQRHELPPQSPSKRQPSTQVFLLKSQICPSAQCRSDVQRPIGRQVLVLVSQKVVGSLQSESVEHPDRSWQKPAGLQYCFGVQASSVRQ